MGDSEDEYDRRRRDKFRRERSDFQDNGRGGPPRVAPPRDDWPEQSDPWGRSRRDYPPRYDGPGNKRQYSPTRGYSPPGSKRMRGEWNDSYGRSTFDTSTGGSGYPAGSAVGAGGDGNFGARDNDFPTQPPMMSFKLFLQTQADDISDEEAIKKYGEYKVDFKKQQMKEFFLNHKDEEWFRIKYHPEDAAKRKEEQAKFLQERLRVFMELYESKALQGLHCDVDESDRLLFFMDTVVIKLAGGTDADMKVLEAEYKPIFEAAAEEKREKQNAAAHKPPSAETEAAKAEEVSLQDKAKKLLQSSGEKKESSKKKASKSDVESGEEESDSDEEEDEPLPPGAEEAKALETKKEGEAKENAVEEASAEKGISSPKEDGEAKEGEKKSSEGVSKEEEGEEVESPSAVCPLHKTSSIFLRTLAPNITKLEVETMCKRFDGFLRAAIADPAPERRWYRRGWVTFKRDVNIKEICWNLNNARLRDTELGAIVNRDLSRRIRTVNGITNHRQVIRNDLRLASKIIENFDGKGNLWTKDPAEGEGDGKYGLESSNPMLKGVADYLIEEASAEEEELLGGQVEENGADSGDMQRDEGMVSVLDRLLLYLRVVHSFDYYNHAEYAHEDEMPNRCGILHARGQPISRPSAQEVTDWVKGFEGKIKAYTSPSQKIEEALAKKLGLKDAEEEVEKFILANTQELSKDKWLCPLSGKKFRGPDFVRKHIFNKHAEKIEEVKKEVEYYNSYVFDPKRPALPEHPQNAKGGPAAAGGGHASPAAGGPASHHRGPDRPIGMGHQGGGFGGGPYGGYGGGGGYRDMGGWGPRGGGGLMGLGGAGGGMPHGGPHRGGGGGFGGPHPGMGRRDPRAIINYHDLDAPDDGDIF